MNKKDLVQVYIKRVSASPLDNNYRILELVEVNGKRALKIVLGMFEADFIAATINNAHFKRPMPYDAIDLILKAYNIELREIVIFSTNDNIIFSKLVLIQDTNIKEITVRISDAIAVAVETGSPIFVEKHILDSFFQMLEQRTQNPKTVSISEMSVEQLKFELNIAVSEEDYERAAKLRDELNNRK